MYVHTQTQCILLLTAFTTADDGVSIDIDVGDGDVELTVDLPNYNPCEEYECPGGEVCQVVVHPTLLQLPVAHCVENESREEGEMRRKGKEGRERREGGESEEEKERWE